MSMPAAPSKSGTWPWYVLAPVLAVAMVAGGAMDLGPAWAAHEGRGRPGTFTATEHECHNGRCTWIGDFVPDGGGSTRQLVSLGEGSAVHRLGDRVRAVDTGDGSNVYPRGGGGDWLLDGAVLAAGLGLLAAWGWSVAQRLRACTS